jgi:hypothetical protein
LPAFDEFNADLQKRESQPKAAQERRPGCILASSREIHKFHRSRAKQPYIVTAPNFVERLKDKSMIWRFPGVFLTAITLLLVLRKCLL